MHFGQANFLTGLLIGDYTEHGVAVLPWLTGLISLQTENEYERYKE